MCGRRETLASRIGGCSICQANLCKFCTDKHSETHRHRHVSHSLVIRDVEEDYEVLSENHRQSRSMINILSELIKITNLTSISVFSGTLTSSSPMTCENEGYVNRILPTNNDRNFWVLINNSPLINMYNTEGEVIDRVFIDIVETNLKVLDIALNHKEINSIFIIVESYKNILVRQKNKEILELLSLPKYNPTKLISMDNGNLLISASIAHGDVVSDHKSNVLLFCSNNTLLGYETSCYNEKFSNLASFVSNNKTQSLYLVDEGKECMYVTREGKGPLKYKRRANFPVLDTEATNKPLSTQHCGFRPKLVTCTPENNILVYDDACKMILVLDPLTNLKGVVILDDEDYFKEPSFITCSTNGLIYIGDSVTGQIRVYTLDTCFNNVGTLVEEDAFSNPDVLDEFQRAPSGQTLSF